LDFNYIATGIFALAIIHTFLAGKFNKLAHKYPEGSMGENIFHFLGEIEVVFGLWLLPLFTAFMYFKGFSGPGGLLEYLEGSHIDHTIKGVNMTEPMFVIVIMTIAATKPVIKFSESVILGISKLIPLKSETARYYMAVMIIAPLLGSFITEPAAMTIAALQLAHFFYKRNPSNLLKYSTVGLLFVNVSIGGTLTHFAAPPVLMVAGKWDWNMMFMLTNFGWKAASAVVISTILFVLPFLKEFAKLDDVKLNETDTGMKIPFWVTLVHLYALFWTVFTAHHPILFILGFMFFLGWTVISQEYQDNVDIKPALLVGFFLAGLVIHGGLQTWWITPLIASLDKVALFVGSVVLTAFNDNAAITYLSSLALPEGFSAEGTAEAIKKYAVVAGAVTGGGLTVIANAPNPAGNAILKGFFGEEGISPAKLALAALIPTIISSLAFMLL
jgi:hypothetical protein